MDEPRRRTWTWIIVAIIVLILIGAFLAVVLVDRGQQAASQPPEGVQTFENLSRNHTPNPVSYEQTPPVGGDHNPVWQNCGYYSSPVQNENAVHSMEHGAVWITYQPDLSSDQVEALRNLAHDNTYVLVSPYPDLPAPVVASAWGKQLQLDSANDPRLEQFVSAFREGPQTPEPGAPCIGGTGNPD
ncbi:MAG: hypothetical protein QOI57_2809 [Rubrobacteraceae bacterium]|jgi:hypothetical protein|nr:hypothetical protein [Rubrobacteraceae bacterium]